MYLRNTVCVAVLFMVCTVAIASQAGHDIMLADFEGDDFGGWEVTGNAFGKGPAHGALGDQAEVTGFEGRGFVNTYHGGDPAEGIMTSPQFLIERDYLNFLIGGGDTGETSFELIIDGKIVHSITGRNEERLRWRGWDVRGFRGKKAKIRIVDTKSGDWGHLNIDSIMLSNTRRGSAPIVRKMKINKRYLNFPIENGARKRRVRIIVDGTTYREFKAELVERKTDVWMFFDIAELKARQIELRILDSDMGEPLGFAKIYQDDKIAFEDRIYKEKHRPQFHFTTRRGWINDENGLVYYKGTYHLFYQHNPFGVEWGNMHWGHAVSDDLVHWKEQKIALYQHSFSDMCFSGTAVIDKHNTSGFKTGSEDAMVIFYTSTGRGECIAYSNDAGQTFTEYSRNPVVEHKGRDPKVFWFEPQKKWVMVVYDVKDGERGFAFYDSKDLKSWRPTSWLGGFFEFPELFEMAVEGQPDVRKWVLHGPDGKYLLGTFDGTRFLPDSDEKIPMDYGKNFYAVYIYSNIPPQDGRVIQLVWMRDGKYPGMPFNQQLTFPCRVSLRSTAEGLRLCRQPVREIQKLRRKQYKWENLTLKPGDNPLKGITPELFEIQAEIEPGQAREIGFRIRGIDVVYKVEEQKVHCLGRDGPLSLIDGRIRLRLLVDRTSLELFGNDGLLSMSSCMLPDDNNKTLEVFSTAGPAKVLTLTVWQLKSIWDQDQAHQPPIDQLFERALDAKGDDYIKLRNAITERQDAVSFLKAKRSSPDWKVAVIAEAILGRIEEPLTYRHYEELLIVPIKAAHGFAHDWMKRKRPDPFERIRGIASCDTASDVLLTGRYWIRSGYRRPEPTPQTNSQPALHQESAISFLVELALKDAARRLPNLTLPIPLAKDTKIYSVRDAAALLGVTQKTVASWREAYLLTRSFERDKIQHSDLVVFFGRYHEAESSRWQVSHEPDLSDEQVDSRDRHEEEAFRRMMSREDGAENSGGQESPAAKRPDPGALARCYAVVRLGCLDHPSIVPALLESLQTDSCPHVRAYAAQQSYSPEALPALRKALNDKAPMVRRAAAETLGELKDTESVPALTEMLKNEHYDVTSAVVAALGSIGDSRAVKPLLDAMAHGSGSIRHPAGIALAKIDFGALKDALRHQDGTVRATAWHTLRSLRIKPSLKHLVADYRPDVSTLMAALTDEQRPVRLTAAELLAETDIQLLVRALKDKSELARQEAADILGDRKYRPAVDALIAVLKDESSQVRWAAVKALGQIKGPKAVDGLIAALNDPDDEVKAKVVHTLAAIGDSRTAEPLLTFMKQQSNGWLRGLACWALHGLPPEPRILEAVVGLLNDEDPAVRRTAASTLGKFRQQGAVSALVRALGDEDSQVQHAAAAALAQIGPQAAKPALVHSDPSIRRTALHEIAERGGSGAFDLLVAALRDPDPGIRSSAVIKLSRRKSRLLANQPALDAVVKMLTDPDPKVRDVTVDMLNRLLGDDAFAYLADALKDDEPRVRGRAVDALKAHKGKKTVGILIGALRHEQDQGVQRVLRRTLLELTGNALTREEWQKWWAENNPDLQQTKK